jgi:uncharacterized protein (DUF362 family)
VHQSQSLVGLVRVSGPRENQVKQTILDSLHLIGYQFSKNVENVVIKPNLCYYWDYSTGQTTDPKFVGALINLIRDQTHPNVNISIVEADASAMKCRHAFKMLGYEKMARLHDVSLVNLSEDKRDLVEVRAGDQSFRLMVPRTIQNADLKINVTKIKYAIEKLKITCALKNIFGCNPYPKKYRYHSRLCETIVALNKVMRFDLCIIDGNIVSGTHPCRLGLVMASRDPVAIDVAAATIAGVNPKKIEYVQLAAREGLGSTSFITRGMPLNYFKERYPKKEVRTKLMSKAYSLMLRLNMGKRLGIE